MVPYLDAPAENLVPTLCTLRHEQLEEVVLAEGPVAAHVLAAEEVAVGEVRLARPAMTLEVVLVPDPSERLERLPRRHVLLTDWTHAPRAGAELARVAPGTYGLVCFQKGGGGGVRER